MAELYVETVSRGKAEGALPSLLFLQGIVPIFSLPGDRMFQAMGICHGKQRPPIMHAYGGAKVGMAQALQSIASEGWIPRFLVGSINSAFQMVVCIW